MTQTNTMSAREIDLMNRRKLAGQLPTQAGVPDSAMPALAPPHPNPMIAGLVPRAPMITGSPAPAPTPAPVPIPTPADRIASDSELASAPALQSGPPTVNPRTVDSDQAYLARIATRQAQYAFNDAFTDPNYKHGHGPGVNLAAANLVDARNAARAGSYELPPTQALTPQQVTSGQARLQQTLDAEKLAQGRGLSPKPELQYAQAGNYDYERAQQGIASGVQRYNDAQAKGAVANQKLMDQRAIEQGNQRLPGQIAAATGQTALAEQQQKLNMAKAYDPEFAKKYIQTEQATRLAQAQSEAKKAQAEKDNVGAQTDRTSQASPYTHAQTAASMAATSASALREATILPTDANMNIVKGHADTLEDAANSLDGLSQTQRQDLADQMVKQIGPATDFTQRPITERAINSSPLYAPFAYHYKRAQAAYEKIKAAARGGK